jgi:hypothetical protein
MEIYVDNDPATFEAMSELFEFYLMALISFQNSYNIEWLSLNYHKIYLNFINDAYETNWTTLKKTYKSNSILT